MVRPSFIKKSHRLLKKKKNYIIKGQKKNEKDRKQVLFFFFQGVLRVVLEFKILGRTSKPIQDIGDISRTETENLKCRDKETLLETFFLATKILIR